MPGITDKKIAQLPTLNNITGNELLLVSANGVSHKVPISTLALGIGEGAVTADSVGLGNVDNTSDLNKPISIAQQEALDEKANLTDLDSKADLSHEHTIAHIVSLQETLDAKAGNIHSHSLSDVSGLQTALDEKANVSHTHSISEVTNLQDSLDSKADVTDLDTKSDIGHQHSISDIINLQTTLDSKSETLHNHEIDDINDLQTSLDNKSNIDHQHSIASILNLQTALDDKADILHEHAISEITGLQTELDSKAPIIHSHASTDLTDISTLLEQIKYDRLPVFTIAEGINSGGSVNIDTNISTCNGYDMDGVSIAIRYKLMTGETWTDFPPTLFQNGMLDYIATLPGLTIGQVYDVEVRLEDINNPSLATDEVLNIRVTPIA